MKRLILLISLPLFTLFPTFAQHTHTCTGEHCTTSSSFSLENVRYTEADVQRFNQAMELALPLKDLPMNELVITIAKSFLGTPYVASTLEKEPEQLTINLRETDCILFVEMCFSLALTAKDENPTFEKYCENVRNLRYDNDVVDGYTSRNHYTSAWIEQGEESGVVKEITKEIGGVEFDEEFSYMSSHSNSYRQLKSNPALVRKIRATEEELNKDIYYYIPQDNLEPSLEKVKSGDMICFNSNTKGLDIAHVAYAYWDNGVLTFIHASFDAKKVIIEEGSIAQYVRKRKSSDGIRVVRLTDISCSQKAVTK